MTASFAARPAGRGPSATFCLTPQGILTIYPGPGVSAVSVSGSLSAAIVPSILGDDLIYHAMNYPEGGALYLPAENWLLGLLEGEDAELVLVWPDGKQKVQGVLSGPAGGERNLRSLQVGLDGKPLSLALLAAPGIWHREALGPSYLERDVVSAWRRPFPAAWITQLDEDEVLTTFSFRDSKQETWRGAFGSFTYPVWWQGDRAVFSLGKKIPPEGEALVYCLERTDGTPRGVLVPADVLESALDEVTASRVLARSGRQVHSPGRPNYVVGQAACATTDKLRPIFEAGQEAEKQDYIREGTEDMIYQSTTLRARADAYQEFGRKMVEYLRTAGRDRPELRPYLEELEQTTRELFAAFDQCREPMHDLAYARDLARQTIELARQHRPGNL
ncbi:MAG: hypothetical protein QHJ73_01700, partial [Armatimonadota bacterium]|nr:hypothetical protein [Armatimonadota bacterium]